jgi:hypothetical protein
MSGRTRSGTHTSTQAGRAGQKKEEEGATLFSLLFSHSVFASFFPHFYFVVRRFNYFVLGEAGQTARASAEKGGKAGRKERRKEGRKEGRKPSLSKLAIHDIEEQQLVQEPKEREGETEKEKERERKREREKERERKREGTELLRCLITTIF